jgi:hypothetical protein
VSHRPPTLAEIQPALLAGALSGLLGALLFATAHALLIVPIWDRMGTGLLAGVVVGAVAGWALAETLPEVQGASAASGAAAIGARFGALLWVLVAPVTAADIALRAAGLVGRLEIVRVVVAVALALGSGGVWGWHRTRRARGAVAGAAATLGLTMAMGGPVAITRSTRALGIFLAVLPAAAIAGAVLALAVRWLRALGRHRRRPAWSVPLGIAIRGTANAEDADAGADDAEGSANQSKPLPPRREEL